MTPACSARLFASSYAPSIRDERMGRACVRRGAAPRVLVAVLWFSCRRRR